ncbi:MAG: NAD-dependent DNA ligase LigA [Candidatus Improbicoccus devescovinae]|nr:MAG: NAD-dependent DNA ligase LigA [Candidatus Improbicoccus devescovinae]
MNFESVKFEYKKCCDLFKLYKKKLHQDDDLDVENDEYDILKRKIEDLEKKYPEIVNADSPLQKIGSNLKECFSHVNHEVKMDSLHDSFSFGEIEHFYKRIGEQKCVVEPKIDGISISIVYKNGNLILASTRGDGNVGENITENIKKISNLPHKISNFAQFLEVRGEVYMPKSVFETMTKQSEEFGTKFFKNPRNAAAGILRTKNSNIIAEYNLEILFFNVQQLILDDLNNFRSPWNFEYNFNFIFNDHRSSLEYLKKIGLPVVECSNICQNYNEIIEKISEIERKRLNYNFQIDGAVVKVNSLPERNILGSTATTPRWAEAYKYVPEEKITKILKIEFQISRTGVLTPIARVDPVFLSGSLIKKVSLHNCDFIQKKDLRSGDFVVIRKAGDIIPEIVRFVNDNFNVNYDFGVENLVKYHDELPKFTVPEICEFCGSKIFKNPDEIAIKCLNSKCVSQLCEKIVHFASKKCMNIEILGKKTIKELVSVGLITSFESIYQIDEEKICSKNIKSMCKISSQQIKFDSFGYENYLKLNATKIVKQIEKSKKQPLNKFIYALGIPWIGPEAANLLAFKFKNFKNLVHASEDEIMALDGLGDVSAKSVIEFLKNEKFDYFLNINFSQK